MSRHDQNQLQIKRWLEACRWQVVLTTNEGKKNVDALGFGDGIAFRLPVMVMFETKPYLKGVDPYTQLSQNQIRFHAKWEGAPFYILRDETDCFELYEKELSRLKHHEEFRYD